jgi:hypothetical protein
MYGPSEQPAPGWTPSSGRSSRYRSALAVPVRSHPHLTRIILSTLLSRPCSPSSPSAHMPGRRTRVRALHLRHRPICQGGAAAGLLRVRRPDRGVYRASHTPTGVQPPLAGDHTVVITRGPLSPASYGHSSRQTSSGHTAMAGARPSRAWASSTPRSISTFTTSRCNNCYTRMKQIKYLKHTLAT